MNIHSFTNTDAFSVLEQEWNMLLSCSITNYPFSTYEWHKLWWEAYEPGDLWVMTFRTNDNRLVGIASFFIETKESGERAVHFVGCEDVTDYLDLLVEAEFATEVYQGLADTLYDNRDKFDVLDLCNIPAESPTRTLLPDLLAQKGFEGVETIVQEVCPIVPLPESFDEYLTMLGKKQGKEVKRKLRRAKAQGDAVNWYIVDEQQDINAEVDKFLALMAASHPEKAQFLQDENHVKFFKSIVPAAYKAGWLQLNFLEVAGEAVAAYVNFDYDNRILVYNSGLDPSKAAALSPGIVLLSYNIEHAIEHNRTTFDFLRGDEQYKYRMGGQTTEVYNLLAKSPVAIPV
ncbi:MAG: GNAT family N-acetyltransferase [Anaerolineae bacterium]|nr:GNAT family N-acetyltransferase [Anaerolineae bacterium]